MSNFDFVNNQAFLSYPSCKRIYEYALQVESNFYSDHSKSALNVRFFLEQFCIFVSELKKANYPGKVVMLGDYWNKDNFFEFLRVFGKVNLDIIKELNITSRSYAHSELEDREDLYPNIVRHIYVLLLWLYKDLGLQTNLIHTDYSEDKIPCEKKSIESPKGICFSSEQMKNSISRFFPNCNEQSQYSVQKIGGKYIIRDNNNQVVEELIPPKAQYASEEDISKMQDDLDKKAKEIETLRTKIAGEKKKYETQIEKLQDELAESSMRGSSSIDSLNSQLKEFEKERRRTEKQYQDKIRELQRDYSSLYEKYEQLVPEQKLREELQQRIKKLAKERAELRRDFSVTQENLLTEIEQMQKQLSGANAALVSVNASVSERDSVIKKLQDELHEKEILLLNVQNEAAAIFDRLQGETNELTKKYAAKVNNLEIILSEIEEENFRYKEHLAKINKTQEIKHSLRVVRCGIARLEEGYSIYRTNANEQKLRALLLQVKDYYESQIEELKEKLGEKEKELEEVQRSKEIIVEEYQELEKEEVAVTKETPPSHKRTLILAICAIILFGSVTFLLGRLNGIGDSGLSNSSGQSNDSDEMIVNNSYTPIPEVTNTPIPTATNTPIPEVTNTPIPTVMNTPVPTVTNTPAPTGMVSALPDDSALSERVPEKYVIPASFSDIPGLNIRLLEEIRSLNKTEVTSYRIRENDKYISLGRANIIILYRATGPGGGTGTDRKLLGSNSSIYMVEGTELIKFIEGNDFYDEIWVAVNPTELSDYISAESTIEDLKHIFGDDMRYMTPSTAPSFATSDNVNAVGFVFENLEGVTFIFDENGRICDYAYLNVNETLSETATNTPIPTNTPVPTTITVPDDEILEQIKNERILVPDSIESVAGVNKEMLEELATITLDDVDAIQSNQNTSEESPFYLGKARVYEMGQVGWGGRYHFRDSGKYDLYRNDEHQHVKFAYGTGSKWYDTYNVVIAISVDSLCEGISANSTLADIVQILGDSAYDTTARASGENYAEDKISDFSSADKIVIYTFHMTNGDDVGFVFNEAGQICDYVYLRLFELNKK